MEKSLKMGMLRSIGNVYEKSKGCKLTDSYLNEVSNDLKFISSYFKTTQFQSFFVASVFALNYKGDTVDMEDIIGHTECNPMRILEFSDELDDLYKRGILHKQRSWHRVDIHLANIQYTINKKITEAILSNQPLPETKPEAFESLIEIFEMIYKLGELFENDEISTGDFQMKAEGILQQGKIFPFVAKVKSLNIPIKDTLIYFLLIWRTLTGRESVDMETLFSMVFSSASVQIRYIQNFLNKSNVLVDLNLVEIEESTFFNDAQIKLTEYSKDLLKENGIQLYFNSAKQKGIICPNEISVKSLYFNPKEGEQLDMLSSLLNDTKLKEIQQRLNHKSLPRGVTVLLYGPSGTGKTETVFQIARKTGRQIMKVDISQSKSMWFGESEKIIKRVFTDYKTLLKESEIAPILLFNEADAIISKRKDVATSNVAQTENAIQNIILEELEQFEGIFIATTNLVNNMDTAFERRFLFKVNIQNPNTATKARIWKSKMPDLTEANSQTLAKMFSFSGGQIDNIVRKCSMQEVISAVPTTFEQLVEFCRSETLSEKSGKRIGFL